MIYEIFWHFSKFQYKLFEFPTKLSLGIEFPLIWIDGNRTPINQIDLNRTPVKLIDGSSIPIDSNRLEFDSHWFKSIGIRFPSINLLGIRFSSPNSTSLIPLLSISCHHHGVTIHGSSASSHDVRLALTRPTTSRLHNLRGSWDQPQPQPASFLFLDKAVSFSSELKKPDQLAAAYAQNQTQTQPKPTPYLTP